MEQESVLKLTSIELAGWVEKNVPLKDFSFAAAFGADNVDGKAFCCLKEDDFNDLFPLLGQKFRFKQWYAKQSLPQVSLWPEVQNGEVEMMGVAEFVSFVRLTCPSLADTLADQQIDGFTFMGTSIKELREIISTIGDRAKCTRLKEQLENLEPEVKGPTKKRKQVSIEKVRQYKRNGGSKYEASWIGSETRKLYPTGWKNGKKIFYRQKLYSPKKRGSITPPHFWDLDFPEDYEIPYIEKTPPRPGSYATRKRARRRGRAILQESN